MTGRLPLPVGAGVAERRRRLEEIRRSIVAGRYRVPAEAIAAAILSFVAGTDQPGEG